MAKPRYSAESGSLGTSGTDDPELRDLYIGLVEKALTHTLYAGIDAFETSIPRERALVEAIVESGQGSLLFDRGRSRFEGRDWPEYAQTMVGVIRLRNVRNAVETVIAEDVPGDLIEAGVWRGGVAILMRAVLRAYGITDRFVYAADSFEGLPAPDAEQYPEDRESMAHEIENLAVSVEEVRNNFERYGLLDHQVRFLQGWFRDTLPRVRDRRWAVIRLDGDMYEAYMDGFNNLYDGLSPGGFVIIDDYSIPSCRRAVDKFRLDRGIEEPIEKVDWTGVYWRKRS